MKVLIDARWIQPKLQGVGRHALNLLLGLSHLPSDLEYFVLYDNPLPHKVVEKSGGIYRNRFHWVKSSRSSFWTQSSLLVYLELSWICKTQKIKLFHDVSGTGLRLGSLPVISTVHEVESNPLDKTKLSRSFRNARLLISVSRTVADELENQYNISFPKIRIISNAIDPRYSERVTEEERLSATERFKITQPYFLCVTAARLSKNHEFVENFAQEYSKSHPETWLFTLNGKSGNIKVRYLDLIEDIWLRPLYANAKAIISPSLYEGFSLPPIESLSLGSIPIVSDIPAHREVLGEILPSELFFNPNIPSALEYSIEALSNGGEPMKSSILEKFKQVRERYSFIETASKVQAVYREALGL